MISTYKDDCITIECLEIQINNLRYQRQIILDSISGPGEVSGISYDGMPKGSKDATELGVKLSQIYTLDNKIDMLSRMLGGYTEAKAQIDKRLESLRNVTYNVIYHRDINGLQLSEIADLLGYSEIYTKKISAANPRIIKGDKTV